jgi:HPt (histidine-containing phosphotransfer) domain-containing protein
MSFDELMLELKRDYLKSMPQKFEIIGQALQAGDVALLREEFHKLKGTGKTYGIPEISELCAVIEQLCVNRSPHALADSKVALQILSEIHKTRINEKEFSINADSRFSEIQKHLQSA